MEELVKKLKGLAKPVLAIAISLIIGWVLMWLAGYDPNAAFSALFSASFKNVRAFATTLVKTSPLLFTGIAVAFAFRGNVFNIGAEGQFIMGAIVAAWAGVYLAGLPSIILIPVILILGALAGAAWGLIPGYLKAKQGVSEVITTIMFNYIALRILGYIVKGPMKEVGGASPQTAKIVESAMLPFILPGTKLHLGFAVGVALAVILYIILFKTYLGYEVRAVGLNAVAANCAGINVGETTVLTMMVSGAIAGLGGAVELSGVAFRLYEGFSPGYGYTAIAVSILAANNPLGVVFSSLLFGILNAGATMMQRSAHVSSVFVYVFQGIIILFIAAGAVAQKQGKRTLKLPFRNNSAAKELKNNG